MVVENGIGVNLEDQTRNLEAVELAHRFFSEAEANVAEGVSGLERLRTFFQFWILKEAALKSIGEGLPSRLDAFEFELDPNLCVVHAPPDHGGPERFDAHMIKGADSCAALVL
ncbi:4'-phosphopantetheinyl transferase family protein [Thermodesulfobacteriota bacterium]